MEGLELRAQGLDLLARDCAYANSQIFGLLSTLPKTGPVR